MCCVELGASRTLGHAFSNLLGVCSSVKSMVLRESAGLGKEGQMGGTANLKTITLIYALRGYSAPVYPEFLLCPLPFTGLLSSSPHGHPAFHLEPRALDWRPSGGWSGGGGVRKERHVFVENSNKIFHRIYNLHEQIIPCLSGIQI